MQTLDALTLLVIVDNATDALSSPSPAVSRTNEPQRLLAAAEAAGQPGASVFDQFGHACHGLSVLLTARAGEVEHTVLFDAGPDADVWLANSARLGVDVASIEHVVLSHWHWDHSGALPGVVAQIAGARAAAGLAPPVLDLHPDRPVQRGIADRQGRVMYFPPEPTVEALAATGAQLQLSADRHGTADDLLTVSGAIARTVDFEIGTPGHRSRGEDGAWAEDMLLMDERSLAADVRGRGLTVLTACAHAGVVNTCRDALASAGTDRLDVVLGGFHLGGAAVEGRIAETVSGLQALSPAALAPGHCTGWRAGAVLARAFGEERYSPSSVGARIELIA